LDRAGLTGSRVLRRRSGFPREDVTADAVRERIRWALDELPEGSYRLEEHEDRMAFGVERVFSLRPASTDGRDRAPVTISAPERAEERDEIVVSIGVDSRFEIPVGGRRRPFGLESALDAVEAVLRAVVGGRVRERIWATDEGVARSEIAVRIGGREFTGSTRTVGLPMRGAVVREIRYAPYGPPAG
jgi:hypothetical protein